jgi:hemerythrin-like domain-containing protein
MDEVLARLDRDHARGERVIRDLEHALLAYRVMSGTPRREDRRETFDTAMKDYAAFYIEHMRVEEAEVLPFAEAVLQPEEWVGIDAEFLQNRDPLAGYEADEAYRPLFTTILAALEHSGNFASVLEALAGAARPRFTSHR